MHELLTHQSSEQFDESDIDGKHLWSTLLKEAANKTAFKLPSNRCLAVLGNDLCGKTTLIARLQGTEDPKKSYGLEYTFIDVKDEAREDQTKLNVWILDGDPVHSHLLKFALNTENFTDTLAVVVVSMAEPWTIVESLEQWTDLLTRHIQRIGLEPETLSECRNNLIRQFHDYVDPDTLLDMNSSVPQSSMPGLKTPTGPTASMSGLHPATAALLSSTLDQQPVQAVSKLDDETMGDSEVLEESVAAVPTLDPSVLTENLGIPIVVVVTKTDAMDTLEKDERYTDEHFDFIQMHIRRFCLRFGATLFYVSVKQDKNCHLLNRYLQSRLYGFPFNQSAYVVERNSIFIPAGWDSEKKIAILEENLTAIKPDADYNDIVQRPVPRKPMVREPELSVMDDQAFFNRVAAVLQREASNTPSGVSQSGQGGQSGAPVPDAATLFDHAANTGTSVRQASGGSPRPSSGGGRSKGGAGQSPHTVSPQGGAGSRGGSEGVLANFFINLLKKQSPGGSPGNGMSRPAPPASGKLNMSTNEIQAELERLSRQPSGSIDETGSGSLAPKLDRKCSTPTEALLSKSPVPSVEADEPEAVKEQAEEEEKEGEAS